MKNKKKTWLWKIEQEDYPAPSYVFGTMHTKDKRVFQYLDVVKACIMNCEVFANEFNLEKTNELQSPDKLILPDGLTLQDLMGKKKYARVEKQLSQKLGLQMLWFDRAFPIIAVNAISEIILSKDMPESLDMALFTFAKEQEKTIEGIETSEEQVEILNKLSLKKQTKSLVDAATNLKSYRQSILKMMWMYENFETERLHKVAKKGIGGMRKVLLYDRNFKMADRIDGFAKKRTIFSAIGAGHLFGKKGVLKLLKEKGAKVTPIPML